MSEPFDFELLYGQFQNAVMKFENALVDVGLAEFEEMSHDSYDGSLELFDVYTEKKPLTPEQQIVIHKHGFSKAYVNYRDGTAEVYEWNFRDFKAVKPKKAGWKRKTIVWEHYFPPRSPQHGG